MPTPLRAIADEQILELTRRFIALPFQYYGEKELHFDFHRLLAQARGVHAELEIIRECPTCMSYKRGVDRSSKGRLFRDGNETSGHHDLVVRRGTEKIAIEFYHGRDYTLRDRGFSPVDFGGSGSSCALVQLVPSGRYFTSTTIVQSLLT